MNYTNERRFFLWQIVIGGQMIPAGAAAAADGRLIRVAADAAGHL